jgi:hypothetical protein
MSWRWGAACRRLSLRFSILHGEGGKTGSPVLRLVNDTRVEIRLTISPLNSSQILLCTELADFLALEAALATATYCIYIFNKCYTECDTMVVVIESIIRSLRIKSFKKSWVVCDV